MAMENGQFIVNFPIKPSIYKGFSMAMLNNQRVIEVNLPFSDIPILYDIVGYEYITYYVPL